MIANYHTHTWRCHHATGEERMYVENAIQGGLKTLGFSDHCPYPYPSDYTSTYKMTMSELEDYVATVLALREEYKDDIEILLGFEAEYYPAMFEQLILELSHYPVDYLIMGQHFTNNEYDGRYMGLRTFSTDMLERYVRQCVEGLKTNYFSYLAHPDLIFYTGSSSKYEYWMRYLCEEARKLNIPLEINLLGIWDQRNYPDPRFWHIVGETGNQVVIGSDAHQPDKVWNPEALNAAHRMVEKYKLNLVETVELKKLKGVRS